MNRFRKVVIVIILVIVSLGQSRGWDVAANLGSSHNFVWIQGADRQAFEVLGLRPVIGLHYTTFSWYELRQNDYRLLQKSGVAFIEDQLAGKVQVNGYSFDPVVDGAPDIPVELKSIGSQTGFRLIQLVGPVRDEWLTLLSNYGIEILQYYPSYTYLVWATPQMVRQVGELSPVRWVGEYHPAYRINSSLEKDRDQLENLAITIYDDGQLQESLEAISNLGATYLQHFTAQPDRKFWTAIFQANSSLVEEIARVDPVWAVESVSLTPGFDDENGAQIVAGNLTSGTPSTGFYSWLTSKGVDGAGITWADVDTGLNSSHPDITGRVTAYVSYPGAGSANTDPDGHGSHTAGAIFGDGQGGTGITDPNGFYWGTGMAPEANLVVQNALLGSSWPPSGGWQQLSKDSVINGAIGSSNSWYTGASGSQGYSSAARTHDLMVRDANFDTASTAEPLIMVFSAGNSGPSATTITEPKEAKNLIVVGSSSNYPRSGSSVSGMSSFSSRGPAQDGRILPNVMAPGEQTASFKGNTGSTSCTSSVSGSGSTYYTYCSGTSMAAPFVSGASALIADWWANSGFGTPSPAMVKALLVNSASDMAGGADGNGGTLTNIPNNNQGWGRANLSNVIGTSISTVYRDQVTLLSSTGQEAVLDVVVADPSKPLKISLVWSDAPGAVSANPTLVNDLNLSVVTANQTFLGNRFNNGWSATGGSFDVLNNIENVYVQNPGEGATIRIQAMNIAGDGVPYNGDATDQDFALVCQNCSTQEDFTLSASPNTLDVCAPNNAIYTVRLGAVGGFAEQVTLSTVGAPVGSSTNFSVNPVSPSGESVLTVGNTGSVSTGTYPITIQGTSATKNHAVNVNLSVSQSVPDAPGLTSPANGVVNQSPDLTMTWAASLNAINYSIEIATDQSFSNIVESVSNITQTNYSPTNLQPDTLYYWRVYAHNSCGSMNSQISSFVTSLSQQVCRTPNLAIPDNNANGVTDTISNPFGGIVNDIDVKVVVTHTYIGDLTVKLNHATTSKTVVIVDRPGVPASTYGCDQNHIQVVLDDEATSPVENQCTTSGNTAPPPYAIDGTYIPNNALSALDGDSFSGNWNLTVSDSASPDSGTLTEWCLITSGLPADFSDLDGSYGVAWHSGDGTVRLGSTWDNELTANLGSDDSTDDGVVRNGPWVAGNLTSVNVSASSAAWVTGWVDWNADGWFDGTEQVFNTAVASGLNVLQISVPFTYANGSTVEARFRVYPGQSSPSAQPDGGYAGGEVEDYTWSFTPTAVNLIRFNVNASRLADKPMGLWVVLGLVGGMCTLGYYLYTRKRKPNQGS